MKATVIVPAAAAHNIGTEGQQWLQNELSISPTAVIVKINTWNWLIVDKYVEQGIKER
jgi:hypothetical protein